ncbi:hypothetical protein SAMN02927921_00612 [Sinomicrobium oceani]|uniref:Uncharacterized protein n=1 Tax=Sinomicrobium oceani TaxID=1150368 RepID=A0A1K1MEJ1_9FLAO|nr:tail fiber protein [Sinomicrobium oceani]SFW21515.1 hypothetical protein SAMN02927921_00612 [Sinomicrobium oceani]
MKKTLLFLMLFPLYLSGQSNTFPESGNVGIGIPSPAVKLEVKGDTKFIRGVGGSNFIQLRSDGSGNYISGDDPGTNHKNLYIDVYPTAAGRTDRDLFFRTGQNETGSILRRMVVKGNGKVGIGTSDPVSSLQVTGSQTIGSHWSPEKSTVTITNGSSSLIMDANEIYSNGTLHIGTSNGDIVKFRKIGEDGADDLMVLRNNGYVGIGTLQPDARLTVNGNIHTREVKVDLNGAVAPDYVFAEDYYLLSLEEVQGHIREKGHLPGVPSAKQMEKEGIKLKEMNLKLLEKVEELTLYVLELKEENRKQDNTMAELLDEIRQLRQ